MGRYSSTKISKMKHKAGSVRYKESMKYQTTIYDDDGIPMESVDGVNNLSFLYHLVESLGLEYHSYFGRGTQARELVSVLEKWSNSEEVVNVS